MKTKNVNNKRIIDWKAYKAELTSKTESVFNECERDMHNMTMKEGLIKKELLCPNYRKVCSEMEIFDQTDLDYFRYEKDLAFGDFND